MAISEGGKRKTPSAMLTVKEVSRLLHLHPNTVRKWSDTGILKTYRIGNRGDRRFSAEDIANFLAKRIHESSRSRRS